MQEEDNEVPSAPVPVVGEGTDESSDGHVVGRSVEEEDDDLVPLNQRLNRSRPSAPEGGADSAIPMAGEKTPSAPSTGARPPHDGRKRLKSDWALCPDVAAARLVFLTLFVIRFLLD